MSATQRTAEVRTLTREQASDAGLLNQILDRVDAIAVQQSRPSPVHLRTWQEIEAFAVKAARSGMVPKDYIGKPDAICIAIQMGSELGLAPMQALQNIAVINGRPSIWGDAIPALIRASGKCEYHKEWTAGEGDTLVWHVEFKRKDDPNPIRRSFGVADAKKAGLWGKDLYQKYPSRMIQMRARGFAARDAFADALKGLITAEEVQDIPFEATGLTPRMPTATEQAIGDTLPAHSSGEQEHQIKKKTWRELLDELEAQLSAAAKEGKAAVDAIIYSERVERMEAAATNGTKERLTAILDAAKAATAGMEEGDGVPAGLFETTRDPGEQPA